MNRIRSQWRVIAGMLGLFGLAGHSSALGQIHHLAEMTTDGIAALDRSRTVVLLPGGILEQHGPYLPSFTDGYVNERVTRDLAETIVERPGWNVLIFPTIPLGTGGANEIGRKYSFSGTYAIRFEVLRAIFMDLATELGEQGFRWIFVIHTHGAPNHNRALDQAGDYFHDTYGGEMINLWGIGFQSGEDFRTEAQRIEDLLGVHAGMNEASRMMFLRPDLVAAGITDAPPQAGDSWEALETIALADGWPGYLGSPRLASAAHGAQSLTALSTGWGYLVTRILDGYDYRELPRYTDVMRSIPVNVGIDSDALERDALIEERQREWLRRMGLVNAR